MAVAALAVFLFLPSWGGDKNEAPDFQQLPAQTQSLNEAGSDAKSGLTRFPDASAAFQQQQQQQQAEKCNCPPPPPCPAVSSQAQSDEDGEGDLDEDAENGPLAKGTSKCPVCKEPEPCPQCKTCQVCEKCEKCPEKETEGAARAENKTEKSSSSWLSTFKSKITGGKDGAQTEVALEDGAEDEDEAEVDLEGDAESATTGSKSSTSKSGSPKLRLPDPAPPAPDAAHPKPDLIITAEANHFDRAVISTFLYSLRDTGSKAEVLLFTTDADDLELRVLADEFAPVTLANWTVKEGEDLVIVRFGFYVKWLAHKERFQHYRRIFLSDLDVVFFKDPFGPTIKVPQPSGLALFAENRTLTIGMCEAHRYWINECDGKLGDLWKLMATESRICAGTVIGTADAVYMLLDKEVSILNSTRCNDQLTLQYLHYSKQLAKAIVYHTEDGPGATLGTELFWSLDRWGRVINMKGEVVTFAHQFRYHEGIAEVVARRWPYLPRGDVREEAAVPIPTIRPSNISAEDAQKVINAKSGGPLVWRTCNWAKITDCPHGMVNQEGSHDPKPDIIKGWKTDKIAYPKAKAEQWEGIEWDPSWGKDFDWVKRSGNATVDKAVALHVALTHVPAPTATIDNTKAQKTAAVVETGQKKKGEETREDDVEEVEVSTTEAALATATVAVSAKLAADKPMEEEDEGEDEEAAPEDSKPEANPTDKAKAKKGALETAPAETSEALRTVTTVTFEASATGSTLVKATLAAKDSGKAKPAPKAADKKGNPAVEVESAVAGPKVEPSKSGKGTIVDAKSKKEDKAPAGKGKVETRAAETNGTAIKGAEMVAADDLDIEKDDATSPAAEKDDKSLEAEEEEV